KLGTLHVLTKQAGYYGLLARGKRLTRLLTSASKDPCRTPLTAAAVTPCPLSIQLHVTQADMKALAASGTATTASCTTGRTVVGGGILQDRLDGTQPTNGLRIHGTIPAKHAWTAVGGFGGQGEPGDEVKAFALCATGGPSKTMIVSKTVPGPFGAATTKKVT